MEWMVWMRAEKKRECIKDQRFRTYSTAAGSTFNTREACVIELTTEKCGIENRGFRIIFISQNHNRNLNFECFTERRKESTNCINDTHVRGTRGMLRVGEGRAGRSGRGVTRWTGGSRAFLNGPSGERSPAVSR